MYLRGLTVNAIAQGKAVARNPAKPWGELVSSCDRLVHVVSFGKIKPLPALHRHIIYRWKAQEACRSMELSLQQSEIDGFNQNGF